MCIKRSDAVPTPKGLIVCEDCGWQALRELAIQEGQERLPAGLLLMRNVIVGQVKMCFRRESGGKAGGRVETDSHGELEEVKESSWKK